MKSKLSLITITAVLTMLITIPLSLFSKKHETIERDDCQLSDVKSGKMIHTNTLDTPIIHCNDSAFNYNASRRVPFNKALKAVELTGKFFGMIDQVTKNSSDPSLQLIHDLYYRYAPHAWHIPKADIDSMINYSNDNNTASGVRVYMAINCGKLHLFMVPTYKETVADGTKKIRDLIPEDSNGGAYVYDFINPCPKTCDGISSLQTAFKLGKGNPFTVSSLKDDPCQACAGNQN